MTGLPPRQVPGALRNRGFTLVELIMTMIVIAILAVVALPRFASRQTFETRGFADEALAAMQYARKEAVATRRNVCLAASGSTLTLTMATLGGSSQACSASVINPATGAAFSIQPRHSDVSLVSSTPSTLNGYWMIFDGQGRPMDGSRVLLNANATAAITGDAAYTLGVVAGTGYAYVQ